jgi:hypothetical protein
MLGGRRHDQRPRLAVSAVEREPQYVGIDAALVGEQQVALIGVPRKVAIAPVFAPEAQERTLGAVVPNLDERPLLGRGRTAHERAAVASPNRVIDSRRQRRTRAAFDIEQKRAAALG